MAEFFLQCRQCGKYLKVKGANSGDVIGCPACGSGITVEAQQPAPLPEVTPYQQEQDIPFSQQPPPMPLPQFAGFWVRLTAHSIDSVILMVVCAVAIFIAFSIAVAVVPDTMAVFSPEHQWSQEAEVTPAEMQAALLAIALVLIPCFVILFLYYVIFTGACGQTIGKMAVGIKVVNNKTFDRISYAKSMGRYFAYGISHLIFDVGFIVAGFTERKQALHDIICDTVVIYKK
ncbi:MAG: RDD family protein [Planctomycetes bacterium]|nr:RDD family protein [Planctomycetota bacterium]